MSIIEGEIWSATRGFNKDNIVDKGGCSTIYRGVLRDGQTVAVKVYKHSDHTGEEQFIAEYNSLKDLRHRNIVRIIEWCSESKLKALVFKFMDNGSLEKQLHELHGSNLPWTVRMNVVQGVANALSYLHEEAASTGPIIHRDIKPANIFLDQNMEAHLGDFGIATNLRLESSMHWESKLKGSIGYVAPEYGSDGTMTTAADVYSYGIVILETLTKIRPTSGTLKGISLRSWVESHLVEGRLEDVLDPVLRQDSTAERSIDAVARIGLVCSHPIAAARPRMGQVSAILRSTIPNLVCDSPACVS
ncbi:hypothetical protein SELMODRAFT_108654 [Selaginella moellendorffii]|uniref:Protein kinase domain-containing protein n=1 Tax=Selaginella moellendorffii TaxID=88036 RepID=D8S4V8_SELML|nr:hypothetical protein SELMODRAFT_108654 [Selaginella moellendorffii]